MILTYPNGNKFLPFLSKIVLFGTLLGVLCTKSGLSQQVIPQNLPSAERVATKLLSVDSLINNQQYKYNGNSPVNPFASPEQDCKDAINVCQQTYNQPNSYVGYGGIQEVYNTCLLSNEQSTVWYVFTVQSVASGTSFGFTLTTSYDYDFALYDITSIGCSGVPNATPVRCNFSATYGNTGMSGAGSSPTEDASGPPFSTMLTVAVGETYALVIDNYTQDNTGYDLNFTGNASIFDATAPTLVSAVNNCDNTVTVSFSESIDCSSINAAAFTISGGLTITDATGVGCTSNGLASEALLTLSAVTTSGTYNIGNAGTLLDKCGTPMVSGPTIPVNLLGTLSASATVATICQGASSNLSVTNISGATYAWTPSAGLSNAAIYNPVANTPSTTTTYTATVTYNGCSNTASATLTVENKPVASINPMNTIICSGTTNLTASGTVNGGACTGCTYAWSNGPTTAANNGVGAGTYTVTVTSSAGCVSTAVSSTVSLASSPPASTCNIYYASPAGAGTMDGTSITNAASATTLRTTVLPTVACNGATVKLAVGVYSITDALSLNSNTTLEGGYNATFTTKTSDMSTGNATTIRRTNATGDGGSGTNFSAFKVAASATNFRIQDVRIEMPGATPLGSNPVHTVGSKKTNYGIYLSSGADNYDIVRCHIDAGDGANGQDGSDGTGGGTANGGSNGADADGARTGGSGGASVIGRPGGNGGTGGDKNAGSPAPGANGANGTGGGPVGTLSPGAGGQGGTCGCGCCGSIFCDDPGGCSTNLCGDGWRGKDGVSGTIGTDAAIAGSPGGAPNIAGGYFVPGTDGGDGNDGTDGYGGGGGGGGKADNSGTPNHGGGGGGGGAGGKGATAGTGAISGGGAFGIFSVSNPASANIIDCELAASAGNSGTGGIAAAGQLGGGGGSGGDWCDGGAGGNGKAGGRGGNSTKGGDAQAGWTGLSVRIDGASVTSLSYTAKTLSAMPIIIAGDGTNNNNNCTDTDMNMTTSAGSPDWTSSDAPLTGTGSPKTVAYSTTGRKTVELQSDVTTTGTWTDDFETDKGWAFSSATRGAITANCSGSCITGSPKSGSNVLNLKQCSSSNTTYASITLTLSSPGTFSGYYKIGAENGWDYFTWNIDAVPNRTTNQVSSGNCVDAWTAFNFAVSAGTHTIYLGYSTDGSNEYNGSKTIIDDVQCTNVEVTSTGSNTYTDFNNVITTAPSAGTITSSAAGVCPATGTPANFASSLGSASGFSFQWSMDANANVTPTFSAATSDATNVTFTNSSASTQTVTIRLIVTSQCCGVLTAVTKTIDIYPNPSAPTTTGNQAGCTGGTVTLTATGPAGASFSWYNVSTNGSALATGATYLPTGATTTYYVEATSSNGCLSTSRTAVTATFTQQAAPSANNGSVCGSGVVELSVDQVAGATSYNWYSGAGCTSPLLQSGSSNYYSPSISGNTDYYVNVDVAGCNTSLCTTVSASISNSYPTSATWTGASSNDWFNTANWTLVGGICPPGCNTDVTIPTGQTIIIDASAFNPNNLPAACGVMSISNTATLNLAKGELDVCGNFTHDGTLNMTGGKVVFMGSSAQTYARTSTGSGDFVSVELDNSQGLTVLEGSSYSDLKTAQLTLINGKITTEGSRAVTITSTGSTSIAGHSTSNYIDGRLTRYIVNSTSYDFPVGHSDAYELMNLNFTSVTGLLYVTVFFANPSNSAGAGWSSLNDAGTSFITSTTPVRIGGSNSTTDNANGGLWTILPDAGTATYDMTLYGRNYGASVGAFTHTIAKRAHFQDGCGGTDWTLTNTGTYSNSTVAGNVITVSRTGMTGFSQFAIGKHVSVLPMELVFFDGKCNGTEVLLKWITASETNNDHFTIERSCDGLNYTIIGTREGAGNSSIPNQYSYVDGEFAGGTCYYRLKQTNYDGGYKYSDPIAVNCADVHGFELARIIPNPVRDKIFVLFNNNKEELVYVSCYDMVGKKLITEDVLSVDGLNNVQLDLTGLSNGVYLITLNNIEKHFVDRIVKQD